jgi:sodium/potassium/calcium exchanger 6
MTHEEADIFTKYCNHQYIYNSGKVPPSNRCTIVAKSYCTNEEDLINFYSLYYCLLNENLLLFLLSCFIIIFINFRYLAHVIDDFCAEGLTRISKWLKFSDELAGCTLLAFANGAGDVITAIVASESSEGVGYTIGSLFGAGLFCCCIVIGGAILANGKAIEFQRMIVKRDLLLYMVAAVVTLVFGIIGKLTVFSSLILLGIYVVQVLWTILGKSGGHNQQPLSHENKDLDIVEHHEGSHEGALGIFLHIIDFPFDVISYFTILPTGPAHYSYLRCLLWPFTGTLFIIFVMFHFQYFDEIFTDPTDAHFCAIWFILAVALFFFFVVSLPSDGSAPRKNSFMDKFITVLGVISSVTWMYLLLELLISLLSCFGMVLNLDASFLGFTILAVGNALPDALNTFALMKEGRGIMAISGAYNGQLFGLLVGFGLGNLKMCLRVEEGYQIFGLFDFSGENKPT